MTSVPYCNLPTATWPFVWHGPLDQCQSLPSDGSKASRDGPIFDLSPTDRPHAPTPTRPYADTPPADTFLLRPVSLLSLGRLDRCQRYRVDDVIDQRTA
jgi:hypothetical protein